MGHACQVLSHRSSWSFLVLLQTSYVDYSLCLGVDAKSRTAANGSD